MKSREVVARELAEAHSSLETSIRRILRVVAPENEDAAEEPIKLLEVNGATPAAGIVPVHLGAALPDVPYTSIVIEVTEEEYEQVTSGKLPLPNRWSLRETLFERAA